MPIGPPYGNTSRAWWVPAISANQVPSITWSSAAAAAACAARTPGQSIEPEVSTMTISPASPALVCPA